MAYGVQVAGLGVLVDGQEDYAGFAAAGGFEGFEGLPARAADDFEDRLQGCGGGDVDGVEAAVGGVGQEGVVRLGLADQGQGFEAGIALGGARLVPGELAVDGPAGEGPVGVNGVLRGAAVVVQPEV